MSNLYYISDLDLESIPKSPPEEFIYLIFSWIDTMLRSVLPEDCISEYGVKSPYKSISLYDVIWIVKKLKERDYERDLQSIIKELLKKDESEVKSLIVLEKLSGY